MVYWANGLVGTMQKGALLWEVRKLRIVLDKGRSICGHLSNYTGFHLVPTGFYTSTNRAYENLAASFACNAF